MPNKMKVEMKNKNNNINENEKDSHKLIMKDSGICGINANYKLEANELVISGKGDMTDYSSQNDVPWYPNYTIIKSVIISDGITRIGNFSFYYHMYIKSISIPDSVTSIGYYAFYLCRSLQTIKIPNSVQSIEPHCFNSCAKLELTTIPEGITTIRERIFYSCSSISTFTIPDSVISIESHAFAWSGLINITIKNSVKLIGKGFFSSCYKLINASYIYT